MSYHYNSRRSSSRFSLGWGIFWVILVGGLFTLFSMLWGFDVHFMRTLFVEGATFALTMTGIGIAAVLVITLGAVGRGVLATLVGIGSGAGLILLAMFGTYETQKMYISSVEIENSASITDYAQRVPYEIAVNQVDKNMGDSTGNAEPVRSVSAEGEYGLWNALIVQRGFATGYESIVSIDSPTFGNVSASNVERCYFSENATLRMGGALPHNDLKREIIRKNFWSMVTFHNEDVYGYCDGDTPIVVVPLIERQGWFFYSEAPWGVATYNGTTGVLDITQDIEEIAEIPGPTYSIVIAKLQREALQSYNGTWWEHAQGLLGWDVVGNTEVQLRVLDRQVSDYITALQPRGASTNVVAMSVVDAHGFIPRSLNPMKVYMLPQERVANETIIDTIHNEYSWMPEFAGNNYFVWEITPGKDGNWVASVGTNQSVVYHVLINETGSDLQLIDRAGNIVTRAGVIQSENSDAPTIIINENISNMTEAELIEMLRQVADRLDEIQQSKGTTPTTTP